MILCHYRSALRDCHQAMPLEAISEEDSLYTDADRDSNVQLVK